jgi:Fe-S oxidoreductase
MALADYKGDVETCCRCSACKFITLENVKGIKNTYVCPSIARYNFHAYSGGGRMGIGAALVNNELSYESKNLADVFYNCQMCGACDVSCKYAMDMEVLEPMYEMRIGFQEKSPGQPSILNKQADNLRQQGRMILTPGNRTDTWYKNLDVKDYTAQKTSVVYHAGCRVANNPDMWKVAQSNIILLQKAGVDIGIARESEFCCGGRAYSMGFKEDFLTRAKANMEIFQKAGATTLVTGCAECYQAFKVLYDKFNLRGNLKVLHTSEYFASLIKDGKIKPTKKINLKVTYHDPCHLGRLGEPWIHWKGKQLPGHIRLFDPPKEFRRGTYGVYEPPRDVLKSIPGLKLVEMDRTKEYAWCCGAGGGVKESNPEFAAWTAQERLREAQETGAEALVTACPGCVKNFSDALHNSLSPLKVYDLTELLNESIL